MSALKTRDFVARVAIRDRPDDPPAIKGNTLAGYAAVFGVESEVLCDRSVCGGRPFVEVIDPGAFRRSLERNPDVRALYNHDTSIVLGRTKSGTLGLKPDATGLGFACILPDTQAGRDVKAMIRRGDIDGCSFGFVVVEDRVEDRGPDLPALRTLLDVDLHEISPAVAFPAYPSTSVAVRARREARTPVRDLCAKKLQLLELDLDLERLGVR